MKECSRDPGIFLSTASQENVRNPPISIKNNFIINSAWMFAITNVTKTSLNKGKMLPSASVSKTHVCLLYCAKMQEPHTSSLCDLHMGFCV